MQNLKCYADSRNKGFCVHCGGPDETDDHVPSKVLLDEPYPENLMVCPSCARCNNLLSDHETYLACLLECVLAGCADPSKLLRPKIARVLERNELLLGRLKMAMSEGNGGPVWSVENERVKAVVMKLARGHAAYEYNDPQLEEPSHVSVRPLLTMTENEREAFECSEEKVFVGWPEVGSRAIQRLLVAGSDVYREGWLVVQDGNYRFVVSQQDGLTVKIVLREYLACRVVWE
ncbi:MAG TPA: hypothetical protein VG273_01160 [Bryobacteraceae bacterium]|jgi:hypothetical protein|nr:hypothetical protein [Bryobacteraceae bacterium]